PTSSPRCPYTTLFRSVGAVVDAPDLAELQRVQDNADVAVAAEPHPVVLEGGLVAVAAFVAVAADVDDRRQFALGLFGPVEVGGRSEEHTSELQSPDPS